MLVGLDGLAPLRKAELMKRGKFSGYGMNPHNALSRELTRAKRIARSRQAESASQPRCCSSQRNMFPRAPDQARSPGWINGERISKGPPQDRGPLRIAAPGE